MSHAIARVLLCHQIKQILAFCQEFKCIFIPDLALLLEWQFSMHDIKSFEKLHLVLVVHEYKVHGRAHRWVHLDKLWQVCDEW